MKAKASVTLSKVLSEAFTFASAKMSSQVSAKWPPCPLLILLSRVTDLASSEVYVDELTVKYAFMALIQWTASSVSPEKFAGSAALISAVLVVVDIGFTGGGAGLAGGCGGGTVDRGAVINEVVKAGELVVDTAGDAVVTRRVTGGKGLVTGMLGCELEDGREVMHLGGKGRDAGLAVYCHPKTLFEDEEGSVGILGLVGD